MNQKINFLFLSLLLVSVSCGNKKETTTIETQITDPTTLNKDKITSKTKHMKIIKINSKKENRNDGDYNQMTLFEVNDHATLDELKDYCLSVKPDYSNGYFQILVFFKKPNSTKFPNNPLTAFYDNEEDQKNIKAVYTINNKNGYSKLDYYEKNNWESLAQEVEIN